MRDGDIQMARGSRTENLSRMEELSLAVGVGAIDVVAKLYPAGLRQVYAYLRRMPRTLPWMLTFAA